MSKSRQLKSWFISQLLISSPILLYVIFSIIVGFAYGYYLLPMLFLCFVLGVSWFCAFLYTHHLNTPIKAYNSGFVIKLAKNWKKSLLIIPLLHIFDKHQITFLLTKLIAIGLAFGLIEILSDINQYALGALIAVVMAISNTILAFEIYRFERQYLSFALNFPTKLSRTFNQWILIFVILTLPEIIALKIIFNWSVCLNSFLLLISVCLFLKALLLMISLNMKSFLHKISVLLFLSVILIQFGASQFLGFTFLLMSSIIFYKKYHHQT